MIIYVMMKSVSKTRSIDKIPYEMSKVDTLESLIKQLVNIEIDKYEKQEIKVKSQEELDSMIMSGKVSFGFKYNDNKVDREQAESVAIDAFEDGLFVVFINDKKIENLHQNIQLNQYDHITLVRLTMLTGRYY